MPRLPRKPKVDVTKCHACHVKRRRMSPSATPATQSEGGCHQVPRLPTQSEGRWAMSATPATHSAAASPATKPSKRATQCYKRHACHAKRRWMSTSATPTTQNEGGCHQVPRLPRETEGGWAISATPATQNAAASPATKPSKRATQCHKCHACHAKRRWMSPSATPAT